MTAAVLSSESGLRVRVEITETADGPRLDLGGLNCNLEGEMPGEYYLTPVGGPGGGDHYSVLPPGRLDRLALNVALIEYLTNPYGGETECPRCHSTDVALWADDGEDPDADHAACNECGWDADQDEPLPAADDYPKEDPS